MMNKGIYLSSIILLGLIGGFLIVGYGTDDRGVWWVRSHLEIIEEQLQSIKCHLQDYQQIHGRYPTNDEGLTVLDNYDARFAVSFYYNPEEIYGELTNFYTHMNNFWQFDIKKEIQEYREKNNQVPQNEEDFWGTRMGSYLELYSFDKDRYKSIEIELAIGRDNELFFLYPGGILSPWLVPYIYENRNGLDQAIFTDSPAPQNKSCRYSICVDKGIYVYSTGGEIYTQLLHEEWLGYYFPRILGLFLILTAFLLLIIRILRKKSSKILGVLLLVGSVTTGATLSSATVSCYIMNPFFNRRDPKMIERQRQMLDKYHNSGVINDAAYEKALSSLEKEFMLKNDSK